MVSGKTAASRWVRRYLEAWSKRDPKAAASLFSEDVVYQSHPFRPAHNGRIAVLEYTAGAFHLDEVYRVQFGKPVVEGPRAAVEYWGEMKENGKDVTIAGCVMLKFSTAGLCNELRDYWTLKEGRQSPPEGTLGKQGKPAEITVSKFQEAAPEKKGPT